LTLEYEPASEAICSDIAIVAHACRSRRVLSAANIAADAITDALHSAAGDPDNPRWILAFTRLAEFLKASPASTSPAFFELQRFLNENVENHEALLATDPSEQEGGVVVLARQLQPDC
jgi:hypothetical protein